MLQNFERYIEKIGFEWIAFCLILILGICLRIVMPPYQVPDEVFHFARTWQISEGKFISPAEEIHKIESGDNPTIKDQVKTFAKNAKILKHSDDEKLFVTEVPKSMIPPEFTIEYNNRIHVTSSEQIKNFISDTLDSNATETLLIAGMGQYFPLAYFPQSTSMFFGRLFNFNAGTIYYLACFVMLIFAAICVLLSMKLLPEKKFLIFLIATLPMYLSEIISTSADAMIYSVCTLGTAWLISMRKKTEPITDKEIFFLVVLSISLALLKSVYGAILLLYFLMPSSRFKKFSYYIAFGIFLLLLELFTSSVWNYLSVELGEVSMWSRFYMGYDNVDVASQKNFMLNNFGVFLKTFFDSVINLQVWFTNSFVGWIGSYLGMMPDWFCKISIGCIFIGSIFGDLKLNAFQRAIIFVITLSSFFGIFAIEYLMWTPVGNNIIDGVQGRYFIPIALVSFSIFSRFNPPKYSNIIFLLIGIFTAAFGIWINYSTFFTN